MQKETVLTVIVVRVCVYKNLHPSRHNSVSEKYSRCNILVYTLFRYPRRTIVPFLDTIWVEQCLPLAMKSSSYPQHWKWSYHKHSFTHVTSYWWSSFPTALAFSRYFTWPSQCPFFQPLDWKAFLFLMRMCFASLQKRHEDKGGTLHYSGHCFELFHSFHLVSFSFHNSTIGWISLTLHKRNRDCKLVLFTKIRLLLILNYDILSPMVAIFKLMLSWRIELFTNLLQYRYAEYVNHFLA